MSDVESPNALLWAISTVVEVIALTDPVNVLLPEILTLVGTTAGQFTASMTMAIGPRCSP